MAAFELTPEGTNKARRRLSFGDTIGRPLIHKLVKPIKVARPRFSDEVGRYQLFVAEAESQIRGSSCIRSEETECRCVD